MHRLRPFALTTVAFFLANGCANPPAPPPPLVRIIATDLSFQIPDSIPSGRVTLRLVNAGQAWHEAQLDQLQPGSSAESYVREANAGADFPSGAIDLGGPGIVAPGDSSDVTLDITPGRYVVLCWSDNHVKAGMIVAVQAGGAAATAPPPAVLAELGLEDFHFALSQPLRAGRQVVHVTNVGKRVHSVAIYRLAEGRSVADFGAWYQQRKGPPPAVPVGGLSSMVAGREAWMALSLPPGRYFMACGVPEGQQIHAQLGMLQEFVIGS